MKFPFEILKVMCVVLVITSIDACKHKNEQKADLNKKPADKILDEIIAFVKEPQFKTDVFNILDFGAIADGKTLNTNAIEKAIQKCSRNGGGVVLIPNGKFLTGAIHLESNVNLHLEDNAEVLFSTNPDDYYPLVHTSFEGIELLNYSPLIYAYKKSNIAITGKGTFNGQANETNWWPWKGSPSSRN